MTVWEADMNPFGAIDITENKKNERINGAEFIVESTSSGQAKALENETENAEELLKKSKLPLPLRIVEYVCGILATVVVVDLLRATTDEDAVTLTEAYDNARGSSGWAASACLCGRCWR